MNKKSNIEDFTCKGCVIHEDKVNSVKKKMLADEDMVKLAEIFKILGEPARLKIIFSLFIVEELCVCDIAAISGISQSAISHHLRVFRNMDLVKYRKEGKIVYYSLKSNILKHLFMENLKYVKEES